MKKLFYQIQLISLFTFIWIILNEQIGLIQILSGVTVSIITIVFTNNLLLVEDYKDIYVIHPRTVMKYFFHLIIQIYKSGISSMIHVIKGNEKVGVYEYKTFVKSELKICMLANAITLTPGTVTIDKTEQKLKILYWEDGTEPVPSIFDDILKESEE